MKDDDLTAAQATRVVRKALDDAEIAPGDYEVHSHKDDDGVVTTVAVSGWAPPELTRLVGEALKSVPGASKPTQTGKDFELHLR